MGSKRDVSHQIPVEMPGAQIGSAIGARPKLPRWASKVVHGIVPPGFRVASFRGLLCNGGAKEAEAARCRPL